MKKTLLILLSAAVLFTWGCQSAQGPHMGKKAQAERKTYVNSLGMEFVYIPPGTFTMGSPEGEEGRISGEDAHQVTLTRGFYMMTTEVTQGHWEDVMGTYPSYFTTCGYNCPVENISWYDTQEFINELNKKEKTNKYRLPTEAEWEYACRAGTKKAFYFGKCLSSDDANYDARYPLMGCREGEFRGETMPVKSYKPNAFGLYDMHGNVLEACQDWYSDHSSDEAVTDPTGPIVGVNRVYRGGSWNHDGRQCRSASRNRYDPNKWSSLRGFRLVMEAPEEEEVSGENTDSAEKP